MKNWITLIFLVTTKTARQGLTRSYRQRMKRLFVRLDAALLEARSSAKSLACAQAIRDRPTSVDTPAVLRQNVAECRRLWQRTKKERLFVQHTYTTGETSRRFYARPISGQHYYFPGWPSYKRAKLVTGNGG